jgi:cyclopropane fatty-acyl-phospholipid synthase-like methyltransferase
LIGDVNVPWVGLVPALVNDSKNRARAIASGSGGPARKKDGYVPFMVRFLAWWEGVEPNAIMRRRKRPAHRHGKRIDIGDGSYPDQDKRWGKMRLAIAARLYGDGFVQVGGLSMVQHLINPLELDETKSVLDLTAGLGGQARYIAGEFGAWVTGLEPDRDLAELGMRLSTTQRVKDKASVRVYHPESVDIQERRYHCILMRELLYTVHAKAPLLRTIVEALTPGGTFVLTEFVLSDEKDAKNADLVKKWCDAEFDEPSLQTEYEFKDMIYRLGLELRSYTDETEAYKAALLKDWEGFTRGLMKEELTQEFVDVMMREAELNKSRTDAMNAGLLRFVRVELQRRKTETLLSNW